MKTEKKITCIVCPAGCKMLATIEGKVTEVTGSACNRGNIYAEEECLAPKRILTTTVRACIKGKKKMAPVKTNRPIQKELLFNAMSVINTVVLKEPKRFGDIVVKDILNTGADVVLTSDLLWDTGGEL